jgi:hypothetical protein
MADGWRARIGSQKSTAPAILTCFSTRSVATSEIGPRVNEYLLCGAERKWRRLAAMSQFDPQRSFGQQLLSRLCSWRGSNPRPLSPVDIQRKVRRSAVTTRSEAIIE